MRFLISIIAVGCQTLLFLVPAAVAQTGPSHSARQIIESLRDTSGSRGAPGSQPTPQLPASHPSAEAKRVLDGLIGGAGRRGLSEPELDQLGDAVDSLRSIDLTIYFDFNSAGISPRAMPTVTVLGQALSDPGLNGARFLLGGHTDAKGNAGYNKALSQRRAEAVRQYLIANFRIPSDRLSVVGFGKQRLKNRAQPFADENRCVQVVNLDAKK